jgi:hypothetical protein
MYLVVFLTRYIDLLLGWKSFYLFLMKILFISLTAYTIYLMRIKSPLRLVPPALTSDVHALLRQLPPLLPVPWRPRHVRRHPQIPQPRRLHVVVLGVARGRGHPPTTVYDRQTQRGGEYHGALCPVFGVLQDHVYFPLVSR